MRLSKMSLQSQFENKIRSECHMLISLRADKLVISVTIIIFGLLTYAIYAIFF